MTLLLLTACFFIDEVVFLGDEEEDTGTVDTDSPPDTDTDTDDTGPGDSDTGPYTPRDLTVADADLVLSGTYENGYAGVSVSGAGDLDGDGVSDLIVGAYNESAGAERSGAAYLVTAADLAVAAPMGDPELPTIGHQLVGNGPFSGAGISVAGGEDVDGDGQADVIVAAFHNPWDEGFNGVHVLSSPSTGAGGSSSVDTDHSSFLCDDSPWGGTAAFGGDPDGDGRQDVAVGCPGDGNGGVVYVFDAGVAGLHTRADATSVFDLGIAGYYGGATVTTVGDVDGDGIADLAMGGEDADFRNKPGSTWIIVDHDAGVHTLGDQAHTLVGEADGDRAGFQVAGAGDVDGDGLDDVLVASPGDDHGAENAGAVSLVAGIAWAAGGTTTLPDGVTSTLYGEDEGGMVGGLLAPAGDVDDDGQRDFLLYGGGGSTWLVYGALPTGVVSLVGLVGRISGMSPSGGLGAGIGDVNGDGFDDFAVTDPGAATTTDGAGKTYLFYGEAR